MRRTVYKHVLIINFVSLFFFVVFVVVIVIIGRVVNDGVLVNFYWY